MDLFFLEINVFKKKCFRNTSTIRVSNSLDKFIKSMKIKSIASKPAQLDLRPTGDQEIAGLTPTRSATFFHGDLIMQYVLWSFYPFC